MPHIMLMPNHQKIIELASKIKKKIHYFGQTLQDIFFQFGDVKPESDLKKEMTVKSCIRKLNST